MSDKKSMTTVRWIISGVLLTIVVGVSIALLASGHKPSLFFIFSIVGSIVVVFLYVALAIWGDLARKKIAEQKAQATDLAAKNDFAGAIRIWKELLPQVGEQHVGELLPQIEHAYEEMGSSEGRSRLSELRELYADFFDMTKRMKQLDAKGRTMRQSLADRICETVSKLPES